MTIEKMLLPTALIAVALLATAGCGKKTKEDAPEMLFLTGDVLGTPAKRLEMIQMHLKPSAGLKPSDADFIFIEQVAKQGFGKKRKRSLTAALHFEKADLAAARSRMKSIAKPEYRAAHEKAPWWPTPNEFGRLQFYSTEGILAMSNGFAACYPDGNVLYLFGEETL